MTKNLSKIQSVECLIKVIKVFMRIFVNLTCKIHENLLIKTSLRKVHTVFYGTYIFHTHAHKIEIHWEKLIEYNLFKSNDLWKAHLSQPHAI